MTYLRKRPRQRRSQATFDAIVEAAARILAESGPASLGTNRIAARAGVSVGSLYQYFPNRQAIVRALLERELERAEAARPAVLDDTTRPVAERIRAAVDWHLDVHGHDPALSRSLRVLAPRVLPAEEVRTFLRRRSERIRRTVSGILPPDVDVETAAFIVDVCLDALSDAVAARRPAWLRPGTFREEMAALLTGYLAR